VIRTVALLGLALISALVLGACADTAPVAGTRDSETLATTQGPESTGERVTIDGSEALVWGNGGYGVVLAHGAAFDAASWEPQAVRIAEQDAIAVAVENISPDALGAAVAFLRSQRGVRDVALVGGSAGADAILELAAAETDLPDQLVLLSPNQPQDGLGPEPKLFIASEGEAVVDVSRKLAASAPGDDNEALIIPGSAHAQNIFATDQAEPVTTAILGRLAQFATG
jgi:pimeloyl-ACP methyl ester carboxylesterase